jgi:hypothetical protein
MITVQPSGDARPTFGSMLAEVVPLLCAVPVAGPPVIFVVGPWLLVAVLLSGPLALLLTFAVVAVVAVALVASIAAILAAPFLLFRRYRTLKAPTVARVPVPLRQVVA